MVLKDVIPPEAIPRCQAAWLRLEQPTRADWETRRATRFGQILPSGEVSDDTDLGAMRTFFDVPGLCDAEEAYIDLVDNPVTLPLMSRLCGHGGAELHSNQTDGHVTSAGGTGRVVLLTESLSCVRRCFQQQCIVRRFLYRGLLAVAAR